MSARAFRTIAALIVAGGLAALAWLYLGPARTLSPEAFQSLDSLRVRGLAAVESGHYAESETAFATLLERLPDSPFAARNLAISRLLTLQEATDADKPQALDKATAAVATLKHIEPRSAVTFLLAGRVEQARGATEAALTAMAEAMRLAPQDAGIAYEFHTVARASKDEVAAARALATAHELAPDNIRVLVDVLLDRATRRDPALADALQTARRELAPFFASIRAQARVDLSTLVNDAISALESVDDKDWRTASRNARIVVNVLRPQVAARLDQRRLVRHELEYLHQDFSADLKQHRSPPERETAITVAMRRPAVAQQLPASADVSAATLADIDLDGRLDVVVASSNSIAVYAPAESGWEQVVSADTPIPSRGVLTADLDRDSGDANASTLACGTADLDLILFGDDGLVIFENRIGVSLATRSLVAVPHQVDVKGIRAVATLDVDHDGDLDLVISSKSGISVWANSGRFRFDNISERSALPDAKLEASSLIPVDWNQTVDLDLLVAGRGGVGILENHRHGRFRWRALPELGTSLSAAQLAVGEFDGNVSWDAAIAGRNGLTVAVTQTPASGSVRALGSETLATGNFDGVTSWDYDNDGFLDLVGWGVNGLSVFRGGPGATFESVNTLFSDELPGAIRSVEAGDLDADGDLDLLVVSARAVHWYENVGGNQNRSIRISLSGQLRADQKDERVNIHGVGSRLEVRTGKLYQARTVTAPATHFGLGSREQVDVARVLWTNGIPQNQIDPNAAEPICETQILKGSCPYLYAWDGEKFGFVTDLLWAAPIGLQVAENVFAPAREWEYLLVRGDQLKAADGHYELRITEELWEAAYFDRVSLTAVDHPEGVEVFTNEKVGPPSLAKPQVHTANTRRTPVAASDHNGLDVLEVIAKRDGKYLKSVEERVIQGLLAPHHLELDLGVLENPGRIKLFLTGWVMPTDTSLNIAVSQNPDLTPPAPPSIWVPNAAGEWEQVRPFIGFPGGKTKTMVVDVSDVFLTEDYRIRLATSMELYWDHVFFTVDDAPVELRTTELSMASATLRYRGFSRRVEPADNGPESYVYRDVETAPQWPPMQGRFTDYGDVKALLLDTDDNMVVMGAGDDMIVRFAAPPEPPAGWKRSFVLHNVGWDKDADLNTTYGDTVEPMPFAKMQNYPAIPDLDADPVRTRSDRRNRLQNDREFWRGVKDYGCCGASGQAGT